LFGLAVVGSLAAVAVSRRLNRGYVTALEDSLRSGVVRLDLADIVDSTTSMTLSRTNFSGDREEILRDIRALRGERSGAPRTAAAGDAVAETIADLRSGDPERQRRALRRPEVGDPTLTGHLIPLIGRSELFLEVLRALRRSAPSITGQLLDALLDPRQDAAIRRRLPRVLRRTETQRAVDGLLLGLMDPDFGVRRQSALTLAHLASRAPSLVVPREAVFAAVVRDLEAGPKGWTEDKEAATGEGGADRGTRSPVERGLSHVFALLSLAVEREPLQIAYWAVLGADARLRGTALEYLENVLPDDVRRALWPHIGTRPPVAASSRTRQHLVEDLMQSSVSLGVSQAMRRIPRR
jgi:hypothetical protein